VSPASSPEVQAILTRKLDCEDPLQISAGVCVMLNTCKNSQDLPDILMAAIGEVLAPPGCERCLCRGAAGRNSQASSRAQTAGSALSGGKRAIFCHPQLAGRSPIDPWGRSRESGVVSPGAGVA